MVLRTNKSYSLTCGYVLLTLVCFGLVHGKYEDDVRMSAREKELLERFKAKVIPLIPHSSYIQNYVKDDLYFIKWLRAKNLDVESAEKAFRNHLLWREREGIDTIDDEDWSEYHRDYPMFMDTVDKEGRPVQEAWIGDYNIRQGVMTGKSRGILRWNYRGLEVMQRRLFKARAKGKNISKVVMIGDMQGFNLAQHACAACMPVIFTTVIDYEAQYPSLVDTYFAVNMLPAADVVLRAIRPLLSEESRRSLKTYTSKNLWMPALDAKVARNQRSERFGGTRRREF